jgi:hypothetical protein
MNDISQSQPETSSQTLPCAGVVRPLVEQAERLKLCLRLLLIAALTATPSAWDAAILEPAERPRSRTVVGTSYQRCYYGTRARL